MMPRALFACGLLVLSACTPSVAVRPAQPVIVTRVQYQPIPAYLLAPCVIPHPALTDWGSAIAAGNTLYTALVGCAAQVDAIRNTASPPREPSQKPGQLAP